MSIDAWMEQHPIGERLERIETGLIQSLGREDLTPEGAAMLNRTKTITALCQDRLAGLENALVHRASMDALAGHLETVATELQSFASSGAAQHVTAIDAALEQALGQLARQVVPVKLSEFQTAKQASATYKTVLDVQLKLAQEKARKTTQEIDAVQARLKELETEIAASRDRNQTLAQEFNDAFRKSETDRQATFTEAERLRQSTVTDIQTQYGNAIAAVNLQVKQLKEQADRERADLITSLRAEFVAGADVIRAELEARKEEVEKLVGVIGNLGVTSGFLKNANALRRTTWVWQAITVCAIVGLIVVATTSFLPAFAGESPFNWPSFAGRAFVSLSFAALAGYAGQQADRYQRQERTNRRIALELEAMRPYIASLQEAEQRAFITKIGERTFGAATDSPDNAERQLTTVADGMGSILKQITALVVAAKK